MSDTDLQRADAEIERLRQALETETERCIAAQRQSERAVAEVEEFISMAAHNLRESLRDVALSAQLMAETCAGGLDPGAGAFLERIRERAAGMQSLLTGVVDYWAIGAGRREFSRTDMQAVLDRALLSLDERIAQRCAIVNCDPLPAVMGDSDTLTKVLVHLIRNAIEYCDAPSPRVHVACRRGDPDWVFSVQDNGPGIEPAFRDRIFAAFRRLHGREYPGNGLGLAFCKRAVEWHGGRMWMEPAPAPGSTLCFTLPAAE